MPQTVPHYYLSLQFSAIQKTILRHDRLWSIAGTSQILSKLNEIELPIAVRNKGMVIVAGGGKFTARFDSIDNAKSAKAEIIKKISSTLPMLEFQVSEEPVPSESMQKAKEITQNPLYPGIINELNEQKRVFRGYGVTYNPHLKVCDECGEYPATKSIFAKSGSKKVHVCDTCTIAKEAADINLNKLKDLKDEDSLTTLEKIYKKFADAKAIKDKRYDNLNVPTDFDDLFPDDDREAGGGKQKWRMAVWTSDVNSMGDKVMVWLNQKEDEMFGTFKEVKDLNIEFVSDALVETFKEVKFIEKKDKNGCYIPFRLIVAGGDDLCVVMGSATKK